MYSFLKIFFERNNKIDNTVSSFGNVFRNSKWSNLQTQNIKKLFMKQWLGFFMVMLIVTVLTFTYTGTASSVSYLSFFYIKQTLNELITNCYYLIGCVLYQIYTYINTLFITNQERTALSTSRKSDLILPPSNPITPSSMTSNVLVNTNLFFLQKTLVLFNHIHNSEVSTNGNPSVLNLTANFTSQVNLLSTSLAKNYVSTNSRYTVSEMPYTLSTDLNPSFTNSLTFGTTLQELYTKEGDVSNDPVLTETVTHSLNNIAKQQRWLTRNFWSSQNFVSNSNKLTEAKNFIQNPLLSHSSTDTNIWLSNKLSGLETEKTSNAFSQLTPNYHLLSVFNFFDTSRFFLNQRYSFLNQLQNQFITNSTSKLALPVTGTGNSTTNLKLTLLQSYFVRNIKFNTALYSPSQSFAKDSNLNNGSSAVEALHNLFVSTTFSDLLQQGDLHALNTVNSSTNATNKLYLNSNYSPTKSFKS